MQFIGKLFEMPRTILRTKHVMTTACELQRGGRAEGSNRMIIFWLRVQVAEHQQNFKNKERSLIYTYSTRLHLPINLALFSLGSYRQSSGWTCKFWQSNRFLDWHYSGYVLLQIESRAITTKRSMAIESDEQMKSKPQCYRIDDYEEFGHEPSLCDALPS